VSAARRVGVSLGNRRNVGGVLVMRRKLGIAASSAAASRLVVKYRVSIAAASRLS